MDTKDKLRKTTLFLGEIGRLETIGYWDYNASSGRMWWSRQTYQLLGRNWAEGPPGFEEMARLLEGTGIDFRDLVQRALEGGERTVTLFPARLAGTGHGWYRLLVTVDRGNRRKGSRLFGVVQDVTERVQLHSRLDRCHASLGHCRERISTLRELKSQSSGEGARIPDRLSILTPRELKICYEIRKGFSSKEIARRIGITRRSVETHRRNIRRKLQIEGKNLAVYLQILFGGRPGS